MRFPEVIIPRGKKQLVKAIKEIAGIEASLPNSFK
jgi:hypothetical protein